MLSIALLCEVLNLKSKLGESQKSLSAAKDEIKSNNEKSDFSLKAMMNLTNPAEALMTTLWTNGVHLSAGSDQSNVWLIINSNNEPTWLPGPTNGILKMKRLSPVVAPE